MGVAMKEEKGVVNAIQPWNPDMMQVPIFHEDKIQPSFYWGPFRTIIGYDYHRWGLWYDHYWPDFERY